MDWGTCQTRRCMCAVAVDRPSRQACAVGRLACAVDGASAVTESWLRVVRWVLGPNVAIGGGQCRTARELPRTLGSCSAMDRLVRAWTVRLTSTRLQEQAPVSVPARLLRLPQAAPVAAFTL